MVKIRAIEKSNCENKNFMPKNTSSNSEGIEKVSKVVVDEMETWRKSFLKSREEKLNKEILRKEGIINRLHEEKNVANKKLKEDEGMKENVVENLKKKTVCLK